MHTHFFIFFYFFIFLFFYFFYFFYLFFGAGSNSAHMGWAGPSQPGPVTGPSQWPGWAKTKKNKSTRELITRAWTLVKVIKLPSHSVLITLTITFWNEDTKGMKSYLLLEKTFATPMMILAFCLPLSSFLWPLVCAFLLAFSVAFKTTKMMPVCCEYSLNEYGSFFCLQGRGQFQR